MEKIKRPVFRLCNDSVIKELFSRVPNALILLISDVLNIDYDSIKTNSTVELASELNKKREKNKTTVCDFVVKVNNSLWVNVEINKSYYKGLTERNLLYVSRILSNNVESGTKYSQLPKYKVTQLNINCFRNINGKILSKTMLIEADTGTVTTESLFLYNFDIEKCFHLYYNNIEKSNSDNNEKLIKWGTILYTTEISSIANIMGDDFMSKEDKEKFIEVVEELQEKHKTFTDEEIIQLTEWKMEGERLAAREQGLAEGHAEGHAIGLAEGHAEGLAKGHAEGLAKGHAEGIAEGIIQNTIEHVKKMLSKNYDLNEISDITGLTEEEIKEIQKELN